MFEIILIVALILVCGIYVCIFRIYEFISEVESTIQEFVLAVTDLNFIEVRPPIENQSENVTMSTPKESNLYELF